MEIPKTTADASSYLRGCSIVVMVSNCVGRVPIEAKEDVSTNATVAKKKTLFHLTQIYDIKETHV